jgi:hypothetical protein
MDKLKLEIKEFRDGSLVLSSNDTEIELDLVFSHGAMTGDPLLDEQRELLEFIVSAINNNGKVSSWDNVAKAGRLIKEASITFK